MTTIEILQKLQPLLNTRREEALEKAGDRLKDPDVTHEKLTEIAKSLGYAAGYSECASFVIKWLIAQSDREWNTPLTMEPHDPTKGPNPCNV